jgi:hypothetical protein
MDSVPLFQNPFDPDREEPHPKQAAIDDWAILAANRWRDDPCVMFSDLTGGATELDVSHLELMVVSMQAIARTFRVNHLIQRRLIAEHVTALAPTMVVASGSAFALKLQRGCVDVAMDYTNGLVKLAELKSAHARAAEAHSTARDILMDPKWTAREKTIEKRAHLTTRRKHVATYTGAVLEATNPDEFPGAYGTFYSRGFMHCVEFARLGHLLSSHEMGQPFSLTEEKTASAYFHATDIAWRYYRDLGLLLRVPR